MRVIRDSTAEWKELKQSFFIPLIFIAVIWLVKAAELVFHTSFVTWGILPGEVSGLRGVLFSPFIHGDFGHLVSNTLPMFILFTGAIYFYRSIAYTVVFWITLISGLGVWFLGNYSGAVQSYHIGASGVIYGLVTFLFFSGILRKSKRLLAISMLVLFFYGGLVWGVLPYQPGISWEGHLFGAFAGIICAVWFRDEGPQQDKMYDWEDEDEDFDDEQFLRNLGKPGDDERIANQNRGGAKIRYLYRPGNRQDGQS